MKLRYVTVLQHDEANESFELSNGHSSIPGTHEPGTIVEPCHVQEVVVNRHADEVISVLGHSPSPRDSGRSLRADLFRSGKCLTSVARYGRHFAFNAAGPEEATYPTSDCFQLLQDDPPRPGDIYPEHIDVAFLDRWCHLD